MASYHRTKSWGRCRLGYILALVSLALAAEGRASGTHNSTLESLYQANGDMLFNVQAGKHRNLESPLGAGEVLATIGFEEVANPTEMVFPQGTQVIYRYKYINAVVVRMQKELMDTLAQDSNVAYVSEDTKAYPMAEAVPWGIGEIQADDPSVPFPDPAKPCFKVCIVDSGFSLGHEDLVCAPVRMCCRLFSSSGLSRLLLFSAL
jgi:hypothetical protein